MWWLTALNFIKGKLFSNDNGNNPMSYWIIIAGIIVIAIIVIPNTSTILTKFGFETKDKLIKDNTTLVDNNKILTDTNKQTNKELDNSKQSAKVDVDLIIKQNKKKDNTISSMNKKLKDLNDELNKLKSKDPNEANPNVLTKETSKLQILYVWKSFCEFNQVPECINELLEKSPSN